VVECKGGFACCTGTSGMGEVAGYGIGTAFAMGECFSLSSIRLRPDLPTLPNEPGMKPFGGEIPSSLEEID